MHETYYTQVRNSPVRSTSCYLLLLLLLPQLQSLVCLHCSEAKRAEHEPVKRNRIEPPALIAGLPVQVHACVCARIY